MNEGRWIGRLRGIDLETGGGVRTKVVGRGRLRFDGGVRGGRGLRDW